VNYVLTATNTLRKSLSAQVFVSTGFHHF
jgi:hypothetical protein